MANRKYDLSDVDVAALLGSLQSKCSSLERYIRSNSHNVNLANAYRSELVAAQALMARLSGGVV